MKTPPTKEAPTQVQIGLYLLDIIELDQPKQILKARYALSLHWKDPRLAFESAQGKPLILRGEDADNYKKEIWWPDPQITNQLGELKVLNNRFVISPDGDVIYSKVFIIDTETIMEFLKFPFDTKRIRMEFESFSYSDKQLDYKVWAERTGVYHNFHSDEWSILSVNTISGIRRLWHSEVDNYSYVSFSIPIHRHSAYYLWRVFLPFCFFILLSTCIFWMHKQDLGRRISIVVAFALTAVAFNFVVSGFIPHVSYLTMLDTIILSGYLMCGVTIISAITFEMMKERGMQSLWDRCNIAARWIFPVLYILTWVCIYHVFMNLQEQIMYLVE